MGMTETMPLKKTHRAALHCKKHHRAALHCSAAVFLKKNDKD
jgi:hypothetical protein